MSDDTVYLPTLYPADSILALKWAFKGADKAGAAEGSRVLLNYAKADE